MTGKGRAFDALLDNYEQYIGRVVESDKFCGLAYCINDKERRFGIISRNNGKIQVSVDVLPDLISELKDVYETCVKEG